MSLVALFLVVWVALFLSNGADTLPGILWGWLHWPHWLLGFLLLALIAWCMDDDSAV